MSEEKELVIVYQFGKVASTSLVNALNRCPGIEAHQSHFLGESALQRIIPIAVGRGTSPYFHEHLSGQLLANVHLTYRANKVLSGQAKGPLRVISLCREPMDWFRSGIVQDIDGYRDDILAYAGSLGLSGDSDQELLQSGLEQILARLTEIIAAKGGIEPALHDFLTKGGASMIDGIEAGQSPIVRRLFFLAIRPLVWFDEHFAKCFDKTLADFVCMGSYWHTEGDRAAFVLLRYEDLTHTLEDALSAIGITLAEPLRQDNVSRSKAFADCVLAAFASDAASDLGHHILGSEYARFFGYAAPAADILHVAE
ncbi:MAG: hypothetical protein QNJ20_07685 [Paracoccaceae bacterium]|nr:hypothetical protein [Paracoccaceae bacterium]